MPEITIPPCKCGGSTAVRYFRSMDNPDLPYAYCLKCARIALLSYKTVVVSAETVIVTPEPSSDTGRAI